MEKGGEKGREGVGETLRKRGDGEGERGHVVDECEAGVA